MPTKHIWTFKPRLRSRAFGWRGSHLACQRLKEAVTEIKKVARVDPVTAGDGVVTLAGRIWPAFQDIDTSSGALGGAVYWAQEELLLVVIAAPVDQKTRDEWLDRLWQAIEEDGVNYLSPIKDRWGELCRSREVASHWADRLIGLLRTAWSDPRPGNYVRGTSVCLPSLLGAGRHRELLEVLALQRFPFWHDRKFGMQALLSEGRTDDALAYAEGSGGLNQRYFEALEQLIKELAEKGNVLLVGRGGNRFLREQRQAVHVRLVARREARLRRVMEHRWLREEPARQLLARSDEQRRRFHESYFGADWSDPLEYHLTVNSARLGPAAVDLVAAAASRLWNRT